MGIGLSALNQLHDVPVRVADGDALTKPECGVGDGHHTWRYERHLAGPQTACRRGRVRSQQFGLPVHQVVCVFIAGNARPSRGTQILQELDARSGSRAQAGDPQVCTKHVVQVFLLGTVVLALADDLEAEQVTVEAQAGVRVADDDRRVIDSQEELV